MLAEIETDKATMEWEATDDGVLKKIYVPEGGKVNVGDRIAFIGGGGEEVSDDSSKDEEVGGEGGEIERADAGEPEKAPVKRKEKPVEAGVPPAPVEARSSPKARPTRPAQQEREHRVKASPLARKIAVEREIDLTRVKGTGPGGRIVEKDVAAAASAASRGAPGSGTPAKQKAPAARNFRWRNRAHQPHGHAPGHRRAPRLQPRTGPAFLSQYRNQRRRPHAGSRRAQVRRRRTTRRKITVNDFILKGAVVAALREPKVNVAFDGDAIIHYGDVNLAVAVAIDEGLVTPVIRAAQNKSLREISAAVKDLAHRARNKRMKPEEFQGGTLTVSNLGSYGIDYFSAIINPPQAIILSVGAIVRQPIVNDAGAIVPGYRMKIGMSCDHRVVDGAIGADYLKALRHLLENPSLLLL